MSSIKFLRSSAVRRVFGSTGATKALQKIKISRVSFFFVFFSTFFSLFCPPLPYVASAEVPLSWEQELSQSWRLRSNLLLEVSCNLLCSNLASNLFNLSLSVLISNTLRLIWRWWCWGWWWWWRWWSSGTPLCRAFCWRQASHCSGKVPQPGSNHQISISIKLDSIIYICN